jgi:twitching motility protein PilJ
MLELAQRVAQQLAQGGGLREIEHANQLAVLAQRIAKNTSALATATEIDSEVAVQLGKDAGSFRDIVSGLLKGSDALRLAAVRADDVRASLGELQKRFGAYDAGLGTMLQNLNRLVAAKQARVGQRRAEALLADTAG